MLDRKYFPSNLKVHDVQLSGSDWGLQISAVLKEKGLTSHESGSIFDLLKRLNNVDPDMSFEKLRNLTSNDLKILSRKTLRPDTPSAKTEETIRKLFISEE